MTGAGAPGGLRATGREWVISCRKQVRVARLSVRARLSRRTVLGEGPVVSMTTHGRRLARVGLTVESIARGTLRPRRIVLWLDDPAAFERLSAALRRQQRRGLEIRLTENYGPHTKYYPYVAGLDRFDQSLVTADDDIIYPPDWLADLDRAHAAEPGTIHCHRAHEIALAEDGRPAAYSSWKAVTATATGPLVFATGVSGVIYPPAFLAELKARGTDFRRAAPRADDIWLHLVALRTGTPVRQLTARSRHFDITPGTQGQALLLANVDQGANDTQVLTAYAEADLLLLRGAAVPSRSMRSSAPGGEAVHGAP